MSSCQLQIAHLLPMDFLPSYKYSIEIPTKEMNQPLLKKTKLLAEQSHLWDVISCFFRLFQPEVKCSPHTQLKDSGWPPKARQRGLGKLSHCLELWDDRQVSRVRNVSPPPHVSDGYLALRKRAYFKRKKKKTFLFCNNYKLTGSYKNNTENTMYPWFSFPQWQLLM